VFQDAHCLRGCAPCDILFGSEPGGPDTGETYILIDTPGTTIPSWGGSVGVGGYWGFAITADNIYVVIQNVDANGNPTGPPLSTASLTVTGSNNAKTRWDLTMNSPNHGPGRTYAVTAHLRHGQTDLASDWIRVTSQ
jgi:hypothetical protein